MLLPTEAAAAAFPENRQIKPGISSILAAVKECSRSRDLKQALDLHSLAVSSGYTRDRFLLTALINMYAKCGVMDAAQKIFDTFPRPDVVAWTALISGYVDNGQSELALEIFQSMDDPDHEAAPNARTFVAAFSACASLAAQPGEMNRGKWLDRGREIHSLAVKISRRFSEDIFVANSLINMYSKCHSIVDARRVFDRMKIRTSVSWNTLLQGFVGNGDHDFALEVFFHGMDDHLKNARTYVAALSACAALAEISDLKIHWAEKGKIIFAQAIAKNCSNIFVENTAIDMFAKSGKMREAHDVFDRMFRRDAVSWTALIGGYVNNGEIDLALEVFDAMAKSGCAGNPRVFATALSACAEALEAEKRAGDLMNKSSEIFWCRRAEEIYDQALRCSCCDLVVENTMVDVYAKWGKMLKARSLFDKMAGRRNVVSWTALMQGYVDNGESEQALKLFHSMEEDIDIDPNDRSYATALSACANLAEEQRCRADDDGKNAAEIAELSDLCEEGKAIHRRLLRKERNRVAVSAKNMIVDMYCKLGRISDARFVFDAMDRPDVVSWTALISGYVQAREEALALKLLSEMEDEDGVVKNSATIVAALMACGNLKDIHRGRRIHAEIHSRGLEEEVKVANCLIDLYGKCGCMEMAEEVFDSMKMKTVVSWTSLMCGYTLQGISHRVFDLFQRMKEQGVAPNEATFVCLLNSCSHAGVAEKGKKYFRGMSEEYGVTPTLKHYACMVDLLGRANCLDEAVEIIRGLPLQTNSVIWTALLAACCKWKNVEVGKLAYESLLEIDQRDSGAYVLMSTAFGD